MVLGSTDIGSDRVYPRAFADIPSAAEVLTLRRSRAYFLLLAIFLLGLLIAAIFVAFYLADQGFVDRSNVEAVVQNNPALELYNLLIRRASESLQGLGVGLTNLYLISGYFAFSHILQLLRPGVRPRLFTEPQESIVAEIRETAKSFAIPAYLPAIFVFAMLSAPFLRHAADTNLKKAGPQPDDVEKLTDEQRAANALSLQSVNLSTIASAPFVWVVPIVLVASAVAAIIFWITSA